MLLNIIFVLSKRSTCLTTVPIELHIFVHNTVLNKFIFECVYPNKTVNRVKRLGRNPTGVNYNSTRTAST